MLVRSRTGLLLLPVLLLLAAPAAAQLVAERITPGNAERLLFGGTDADGGIGDWYLSNGIVEVVVDDLGPQPDLPAGVEPAPRLQSEAGLSGGTVLDLGLVGHHNDQLNHLFSVAGLSSTAFIVYDAIEAEVGETEAVIRVRGGALGFDPLTPAELPVVTEYALGVGDRYLTLRSSVRNEGASGASLLSGFIDVMPWTTRALLPFSPVPGFGFDHAALDPQNPTAAVEQLPYSVAAGNVSPADGVIDPVTMRRSGEVSYGLVGVAASLEQEGQPSFPLPSSLLFGASSVDATAIGNLPAVLVLQPGREIRYERRLHVGDRNDVASTASPILRELGDRLGFGTGTLAGDVDGASSSWVRASGIATRVGGPAIVELPDGSPITQFRTDAAGRFSGVVVPEGSYEIELRAPERDPVVVAAEVTAGAETVVEAPPLSAVGRLVFTVEVPEEREPPPVGRLFDRPRPAASLRVPSRITLLGLDATPDPRFGLEVEAFELGPEGPTDLRPETFGSALAVANLVYLPDGIGSVEVRPGRYEVFASRGLEYGIAREVVEVAPGSVQRLSFGLERLVPTSKALSADFHIHSARSLDSSAAPGSRVVAFAAEGVEVMVGTDHDFVLDYAPVIDSLRLGRFVASRVGTEVTTTAANPPVFPESVGHLNAWPLPVRPLERKDGAIEDEFVAPNFLFSRLRRAGAEVIQYNHLRSGTRGLGGIGFFNNIGCGRCLNAIDQTCSADLDCPDSPEPRQCACVGYQPDRPLTAAPNDVLLDDDVTGASGVPNPDGLRNIDFDVIEVANGFNFGNFLEVRRDWFSLLNQAFAPTPSGPVPFIPGTGVSDSHRNALESAGYFRTWVLGTGDVPWVFSRARFDRFVKEGRMVASSGPWIELEVRDSAGRRGRIGDVLHPASPDLELRIRVLAAPWIPVDQVRIVANGAELRVFDAGTEPAVAPGAAVPWEGGAGDVVRFAADVPLRVERDTWLLVEAGEPLDTTPEPDPFASRLVPGLVPHGFTNPVFVDLAGDGFDAPGVGAGAAAASPARAEGEGAAPAHRHLDLGALREAMEDVVHAH